MKRRCARLPLLRFVPLWLWALAVPVRAEEVVPDGRFSLEITSCPTVSAPAVRRVLGIEIGDLLLGEDEPASAAHDRLTIGCVGHFARIAATSPSAVTPFEQVVNLDDFPEDAAGRALALTGLELLATLNGAVRARLNAQQLPPAPQPPARPSPPSSPPPQVKTARASTPILRDTRLGVAGVWRSFFRDGGVSLWGGRLESAMALGDLWQLALDAEAAGARDRVSGLGTVDALSFSSGLTFGPRLQRGALGASLGLGGRVGLIRLKGKSADPAEVSDASAQHPWGGPVVAACGLWRFGRFSLALSAEAGYSFLAFDGLAGDKTAVSAGGPWVAMSLGGGLHL